jgi:hypothetical protein
MLFHPSITISGIKYIGKETNMLDEGEAGLASFEDDSLMLEPDEWKTKILPLLRTIPNHEIAKKTGLSRRYINYLMSGKRQPGVRMVEKLRAAMGEY